MPWVLITQNICSIVKLKYLVSTPTFAMNTDNIKQQPQTSSTVRVQSPDVIVAVGSGDNMQEFECYKINLSFAAEYFDIMLSSGMVEDTISRISFPDKVCSFCR